MHRGVLAKGFPRLLGFGSRRTALSVHLAVDGMRVLGPVEMRGAHAYDGDEVVLRRTVASRSKRSATDAPCVIQTIPEEELASNPVEHVGHARSNDSARNSKGTPQDASTGVLFSCQMFSPEVSGMSAHGGGS